MLTFRKRTFLALAILCLTSFPGYAQKAAMFNSVDQYIESAHNGIWIVEAAGEDAKSHLNPRLFGTITVKVIKVLKCDARSTEMRVAPVFRSLVPGERYLLFGFNTLSADEGGGIMDNGNISPVPLPRSFSLARLEGKSLKEQIELILSARIEETDRLSKEFAEEKKAISVGLTNPAH